MSVVALLARECPRANVNRLAARRSGEALAGFVFRAEADTFIEPGPGTCTHTMIVPSDRTLSFTLRTRLDGATTQYETVREVLCPSLLAATTVNECTPARIVSIADPLATGPKQDTSPTAPAASAQL